ncbi:MAG: large-conductance mechanosensitive channel protein MscL [Deltaproteobacteria bacterium]|nr:large-conductance mechanosensitive channel protein MscL [Deltaproteobacteria bacterium]
MSMIQEFKAFAMRGNVVDLAVGVVIGGAFGKIVSSVVEDLITPIIGIVLGGVDFSAIKAGPFGIGKFVQAVIDFTIIAFVLFMIIKAMNAAKKKEEAAPAAPPEPPADVKLLTEIRDLLSRR